MKQPKSERDLNLITAVDDDQYEELAQLAGQRIAHVAVWDESLADALSEAAGEPEQQEAFDLDLYLEDGVYFELYGVFCLEDIDSAPMRGQETVARRLLSLVNQGVWLEEVAVDDEDGLVLVLGRERMPELYLLVAAFLLEEWEELPGAGVLAGEEDGEAGEEAGDARDADADEQPFA